jgi:hypothetical protein
MEFRNKLKFLKKFFLFIAIFFLGVTSVKSQSDDKTLIAKIGEKQISTNEFLDRSELTIRPKEFKSKNISLNNLIIEKILALEAGSNSKFLQNPVFQCTLKGIKEQLMREKLFYDDVYDKVNVDSAEVRNMYDLYRREYELEFYTIRNNKFARKIEALIDSFPERSAEIFKEVEETLDKVPVRKIKFTDPVYDAIHKSLYTNPLELGSVVGPIRPGNGEVILMKVLSWTAHLLLSSEDRQIRWNEVKKRIHQINAQKSWHLYQANIMHGKRIEFDKHSFKILSNWAMERYLRNKDQRDSFNVYRITEIPFTKLEISIGYPFFTIDNRVWTIGDFKNEIMSHPLVFRTRDLDSNNFREQFKLAIVDMMNDHYLTQEAYKKSLDTLEEIRRIEEMWKDSFLAVYEANSIVDFALKQGTIKENNDAGKLKYWNAYLNTLKKKYSNSIRINYNEFAKISLKKVDMFVIQPGVPYPDVVPPFPTFTTLDSLGYESMGK